jgi:hypothetical protein
MDPAGVRSAPYLIKCFIKEASIMKSTVTLLFGTCLVGVALSGTTFAIEVLQPGYLVETYASYTCAQEQILPRGIACDSAGNLYVSQWDTYPYQGAIYRIATDMSVTRWVDVMGSPRGVVWGEGTRYGELLYVADGSNSILKIDSDGTLETFAIISGGPHSLAIDPGGSYGGYMYTATRNPDLIFRVSETGEPQLFSEFPGSVVGGHVHLAFDGGTAYGGYMFAVLENDGGHAGSYGVFTIDEWGGASRFAPALVTAWTLEIDPVGLFEGALFVTGACELGDVPYSMWCAAPDGQIAPFASPSIGRHLLTFTFGPDGAMYVPELSEEGIVVISRVVPIAPVEVIIDIRPASCPNPLNLRSQGLLPVTILGSDCFDVTSVDPASIRLCNVGPLRSTYEDVATPVLGRSECECTTDGPDGYMDLTLKFRTQAIVAELPAEVVAGDAVVLGLTGALRDGRRIHAADCTVVRGKVPKATMAMRADITADGVVNMLDLAIMFASWLEYAPVGY